MNEEIQDIGLESQLAKARRAINTDSYTMSIGELTNLYRDKELIINPDFQRLFRWSEEQKSKLIESILIGIPIPSIFVAQDSDGIWEVVDGLQRISTLLQLQGLLDHTDYPPLTLTKTKYLPSLEGTQWEDWNDSNAPVLSHAQKLDIKRSKLDIKIIKRDSDAKTKFDLFQRLNSFGSLLSNQEIRNAQLAGISRNFIAWISDLAKFDPFVNIVGLSEKEIQKKYDEELVLRFLFLASKKRENKKIVNSFLDDLEKFSVEAAEKFDKDPNYRIHWERIFKETFNELEKKNDYILRKWDASKKKFTGGFTVSSFEAIAINIGYFKNLDRKYKDDLIEVVKTFWEDNSSSSSSGKSTEQRINKTITRGYQLLSIN